MPVEPRQIPARFPDVSLFHKRDSASRRTSVVEWRTQVLVDEFFQPAQAEVEAQLARVRTANPTAYLGCTACGAGVCLD